MEFNTSGAISGASTGATAGSTFGALGTAIGAIGGGLLGGFGTSSSSSTAKQQYKYQLKLQHDAQNFAKWQMGNAHQQEVADLEAAGLNPILSAGGNGASAGVTEGSAGMPQPDDTNLINATNTAINAKLALSQAENIETNTIKQKKETAKTESEKRLIDIQSQIEPKLKDSVIKLNQAQSGKARQETLTEVENTAIAGLQNFMLSADKTKRLAGWDVEIEQYLSELKLQLINLGYDSSTIGQILNRTFDYVGKLGGVAGSAASVYGANKMAGAIKNKPNPIIVHNH